MDAATVDGYKRAALAIHALPVDEQAWILGHLDGPERERVVAALQALGETEAGVSSPDPAAVPPATTRDHGRAAPIESATAEELAAVLDLQPDWVTAIVIAECAAMETVQEYAAGLAPQQAEQLHPLARHVHDAVKPRVRELVVAGVAERLEQRRAAQSRPTDFETVLGRLMGRRHGGRASDGAD